MPAIAAERDVVFYDGECGLCHALVKFALPRDRDGALAFAPLHGETFTRLVDVERAARLPDSLVVLTPDGALHVKSDGSLRVLSRLPPPWPAIGRALAWLPRDMRDMGYELIASVRRHVFAKPAGACPVVPAHLRDRLLP